MHDGGVASHQNVFGTDRLPGRSVSACQARSSDIPNPRGSRICQPGTESAVREGQFVAFRVIKVSVMKVGQQGERQIEIKLVNGVDPAIAARAKAFFARVHAGLPPEPPPKPHGVPGREGFDYTLYLRTALWRRIRGRVMARDNDTCLRCDGQANEVHHKSYDDAVLRGDDDSQLVPLCSGCHHVVEFYPSGVKNSREVQNAILADKDVRREYAEPKIDRRRRNQKLPVGWEVMNFWQRCGWTRRHDELLLGTGEGAVRRIRKPSR